MDGARLELLRASQEIPAHQPASHPGVPGGENVQPVGGLNHVKHIRKLWTAFHPRAQNLDPLVTMHGTVRPNPWDKTWEDPMTNG